MADDATNRLELTSDIIASFVSNNQISPRDLPELVRSVYGALGGVDSAPATEPEPDDKPSAREIKKSIRPEALRSFIDGQPYKTLTRHIRRHGYTPDSYRARFGLPASYPMTSEATSKMRSEFAKEIGLGRKRGQTAPKNKSPTKRRPKGAIDPAKETFT